jgi:AcrR family transcriptional regulator
VVSVAKSPRPLRKDAQENHDRVLEAARQVFDEQGLDAGVAEVARVAGVGAGTLYRRFATKEILIEAVIHDILATTIRMAQEAADQPDGRGLEHFLEANGELQSECRGCLPRLWNSDHEMVQKARSLIADLLLDAQLHHRVRSDLTNTDLTMIMFALRGIVETTGVAAPEAWRRHLDFLIAGMRPSDEALAHPPLSQELLDQMLMPKSVNAHS